MKTALALFFLGISLCLGWGQSDSSSQSWPTYAPGEAPPGKILSFQEAGKLANRREVKGWVYLVGEFRVSASGTSRAVLRRRRSNEQSPRVVVEYLAGDVPPPEKTHFVRDASQPYQVTHVVKGTDGMSTIYVREIIRQRTPEPHDAIPPIPSRPTQLPLARVTSGTES